MYYFCNIKMEKIVLVHPSLSYMSYPSSWTSRSCKMAALMLSLLIVTSCGNSPSQTEHASTTTESSSVERTNSVQTDMSARDQRRLILFFGDSLTAGYGLDEDESFPSLIQDRIDSLGLPYQVINAGLSGETTAGGKNRIGWVLNQEPAIFILELGANDMLRGLDLNETSKNLEAIIETVQSEYPDTKLVIAGMQAPPNMGKDYTSEFAKIFSELAIKYEAALIPFLLKDVAGIESLNLGDGKHPNASGQKIVMENVWSIISPLL